MKSGCHLNAWNDRFHVWDAEGIPVLQKYFRDSWYVMNKLNVDIPEVTRIQSNRLFFTFNARDWHGSQGKCRIQLKPYDLPASCDSPLPVRHGRLVGEDHRVGQSVQLFCEQGFYLPDGHSGSMSARCGNDRKWHPAISTCEAPCGGNLTAPDGVIYSPGFPDMYPEGQVCVWRIEGAVGTIISLNFSLFDLLIGQYREHDNVSVQEESGKYLIKELTRNRNGLTILSETSTLLLTLNSIRLYRYKQNVQGLKVFYRAFTPYKCSSLQEVPFIDARKIQQQPENDTVTVEYICQYPYQVVGSPIITCLATGQWDNPEPSCAGVCGGISTRDHGAFLSPGFPAVVTSPDVCTWNILGPNRNGLGIRVEFANVSLAEDDILAVYDGSMHNEKPTYYTWQTLPMSLCGTALQMDVRLLHRGDNSDLLGDGTSATCTNSSDCQCRRTQDGCLKCQQSTDITALRQCLEGNGGRVNTTSERELNCTILAIAHSFGQLFGGTVSGLDTSLNCSSFANDTDLSPAMLQCLETTSAEPCIPCRNSVSSDTKFWMSYSADVPLKMCQKSDLMTAIPGIDNAYLSRGLSQTLVGDNAYISCSGGFVLSGGGNGRINCSHSGRWDLVEGAKCTCDRTFTTTSGTITPLSGYESYRADLQCTYNITVTERDLIRLRFVSLNLNAQDTLVIYDGNSTSASVLREFQDVTQPPADMYSSYSTLTLKLKSESGEAGGGFRIKYSALPTACDPSRWDSLELSSPGQEKTLSFQMGHYQADMCTWRISGPPSTAVRISETNSRSYGTIELSIFEGERMEPTTLSQQRNSSDLFPMSYYSRKSTLWIRVRILAYSNLETTFIFKALTSCARPPDPANGVILNTESTFTRGDVLSARCNQGYQLTDQPKVVCLDGDADSMEWIGSMPVCNKLDTKTSSPGPTTKLPDNDDTRETTTESLVTKPLWTYHSPSTSPPLTTKEGIIQDKPSPMPADPAPNTPGRYKFKIYKVCLKVYSEI
ncbi:CUB and sushi domain-containing protein 1-like [Liolophura sinensis]|uniref:CUB and sushi domain-containing protein 1-like n=1 Tax=Liolophura sinensis TaxID=3198878 RepID=UPI003158D343